MTVSLSRDYIYYSMGKEANLILRNDCEKSCVFCPARELKPMRDVDSLLILLKTDMPTTINIFGGALGSYVNRLLTHYSKIQQNLQINLETCTTDIALPLSSYNKILLDFVCLSDKIFCNYSKVIIPAIGDPFQVAIKVHSLQKKFSCDIEVKITEAPPIQAENCFWTDLQFNEYRKELLALNQKEQKDIQDDKGI